MKKLLLSAFTLCVYVSVNAQCNEIFFSEYLEGGGENHAIEIYNPTANTIDLSNYVVRRYADGHTYYTETLHFTDSNRVGMHTHAFIPPYGTYVIVSGFLIPQGSLPACDTNLTNLILHGTLNGMLDSCCHNGANVEQAGIMVYNGDDPLTIEKRNQDGSFTKVDIFGCIGERPTNSAGGTSPTGGWVAAPPFNNGVGGNYLSRNYSLRRHANIKAGVTTNPAPSTFNILAAYDTVPSNDFGSPTPVYNENYTDLGHHTCDCNPAGIAEINGVRVNVNVYPNPSNGQSVAISSMEIIENIEIVNLLGQPIAPVVEERHTTFVKYSYGSFTKGIYFAKVTFKDKSYQTVVKRIVIE